MCPNVSSRVGMEWRWCLSESGGGGGWTRRHNSLARSSVTQCSDNNRWLNRICSLERSGICLFLLACLMRRREDSWFVGREVERKGVPCPVRLLGKSLRGTPHHKRGGGGFKWNKKKKGSEQGAGHALKYPNGFSGALCRRRNSSPVLGWKCGAPDLEWGGKWSPRACLHYGTYIGV